MVEAGCSWARAALNARSRTTSAPWTILFIFMNTSSTLVPAHPKGPVPWDPPFSDIHGTIILTNPCYCLGAEIGFDEPAPTVNGTTCNLWPAKLALILALHKHSTLNATEPREKASPVRRDGHGHVESMSIHTCAHPAAPRPHTSRCKQFHGVHGRKC